MFSRKMIKVISIGSDRKAFEEGSAIRERLKKQSALFDELHVVIFANSRAGFKQEKVNERLWLYPTQSSNRWFFPFDAAAIARSLIRKHRLSGVNAVVSTQDPFESGFAGLMACVGRKKPKLHVQVHTDFLSPFFTSVSPLNILRRIVARIVLPRANRIRVVSDRIAKSLGKFTAAPIDVLPVYADLNRSLQSSFNLHDRYGSSFIVLVASRLAPEKDVPIALSAFEEMRRTVHDAHLVVVGEGSMRDWLLAEVANRNLVSAVSVEPWQHDIAAYIGSADAILITSRFEGYGLTLLEAASAGTAIVSTDVGIARELIPPAFTSNLCSVGDVHCLAAALSSLALNQKMRRDYTAALKRAAAGKTLAEDEYYKRFKDSITAAVGTK